MSGITENTVLVEQTQETDNGIIPTLSGYDSALNGETQLHDERDQNTDMHTTKTGDITTELKAFKEFQASLGKISRTGGRYILRF